MTLSPSNRVRLAELSTEESSSNYWIGRKIDETAAEKKSRKRFRLSQTVFLGGHCLLGLFLRRMLSLREHGHSLLLLLLHLFLAHVYLHADRPAVPERVDDLSVSFSPELVVKWHSHLRAGVDCLLE